MPPEADPSKPEENHLSQIRTFEGDMANAIKKQNESIVSIQQAEQAKHGRVSLENSDIENRGNKKALTLAISAIILVIIGGFGAYYSYKTYKTKTAPAIVETPANQFVSTNILTNIDASTLSRQVLIGVISEERKKTRGETTLEQLELRRGKTLNAELLSIADFLTRLNSHAPNPLVRALDPLFMLGLFGTPSHTFMIIKLASFENAFPGMLAWEPRLAEDILPLFASEEVVQSVPTVSVWRDVIIQNHDTRILKNQNGETVLLYAFFDNNLLIVTDNEESFRALVNRLENDKLSR